MSADAELKLGFQPDIYQRYEFLARLIAAVFGSGPHLRLLDVGSGPARLTGTFLPPSIEIVRTDVSTFDDPDVIQMRPDGSLPFPDNSFDIVLAMDVLEHVPAERRAALLVECQRVATRALIVAGPVRSPEVVAAEQQFARFVETVSGKVLEFLVEHAQFGLPEVSEIAGGLTNRPWHIVTIENSPLAEWHVFNAIDLVYASDLGDSDEKRATNTAINSRAVFRREGSAHYRTFVCAFHDAAAADAVRQLATSAEITGPPLSPLDLAAEATPLLARLQLDLRDARSTVQRAIGEKDAHISKLTTALGQLSEDVQNSNSRLSELERAGAESEHALKTSAKHITALQARGEELERTLKARQEASASLEQQVKVAHALSTRRLHEVKRLEQELADRVGAVEGLVRELRTLQSALDSIRSSIIWKAARPVRAVGRTVRMLRQAGQSHGAPDSLQHEYSALSSSPVFDREWYRSLAPGNTDVGDPVRHYLTRGRFEGLSPNLLFDPVFYRQQNPDVEAAGIDALVHYVTCGAFERRQPHPLFDSASYLAENADVAEAGIDPLAHYITHGAAEGRRPHPLFDVGFYSRQCPDVAAKGLDPLTDYLTRGSREGVDPHPLFDTSFYVEQNSDAVATGVNPLVHFVVHGAREGRDPHLLFDTSFYLEQNPDVAAVGLNPVVHYLATGASEGKDPHPLFDTSFYFEQNPDVAAAGLNPLMHYVGFGAGEGRNPHPLFDTSFYLEQNPDVARAGMDPLFHFLTLGGKEGRSPHVSFDTAFYLEENPDVAASGANPLIHYVTRGTREGRRGRRPTHLGRGDARYIPPDGLLPWFNPLTLTVSDALSSSPRLNVLLPGLAMKHMSGGPNTAIALATALAAHGVSIRFISTDAEIDDDRAPFWNHVKTLTRLDRLPTNLELVDAHDRSQTTAIGANDLFLATAWWTAQQAKYATRLTNHQTFLYLIQDYEPLLHAASTQYALASETYALPHVPIVNTSVLHGFLTAEKVGRFADDAFAQAALVFEPALDRAVFHPPDTPSSGSQRRLLFYARPTNGLRNLFELGVAALQMAIANGVLDPASWDFVGMGEQFTPAPLGRGAMLRPAPWVDLEGYARQMRDSDVLLSLMLSPHPSYPPLEMAASGGISVTTTFATKTSERLAGFSPNIIGVEPTIESIASGLATAVTKLPDWTARVKHSRLALPQSWAESFAPILPRLLDTLSALQGSPTLPPGSGPGPQGSTRSRIFPGFRGWAANEYDLHRRRSLILRRTKYPAAGADPGLISFLTTVWNTDPAYVEALADTVLGQDCGTGFEWIVLDNGSARADTREYLARLGQHPCVRLFRFEDNAGIIGGLRFCLERAERRYVVPLDSDDLLTPDAIRTLTHALKTAGYPALAYTDEDKIEGGKFRDPYFKADWDPVLFTNSCYIAHLCAIDRQLALDLGAYTDSTTEGSHDWDTFTRFRVAGYVPFHVPEVVYSWRMHAESTAGNIESKPYVFASQQSVLKKALAASPDPSLYELQLSPLFNGTPDWWIKRVHRSATPVTTVLITEETTSQQNLERSDLPHDIILMQPSQGLARLEQIAAGCVETGSLVHLLWSQTTIEEDEWPWEAMAHFELFPDTVMIGGRLLDRSRIRSAGAYFGFGKWCDSPDRSRASGDPGYFAQMWKQHSVSAVPIQHCCVRADFLRDALRSLARSNVSLAGLGPWLGAAAHTFGMRVVYSPFFTASTSLDLDATVSDVERAAFRSAHRTLIPEERYLSRSLGLSRATAYKPTSKQVRLAELAAAATMRSYTDWAAADAIARAVTFADGASSPTFSLLTTLYSGTRPDLFRQTAQSLFDQKHGFAEWVILVHGPIAPDVDRVVEECSRDPRVRVLRRKDNLGIVGGLRLCLEHASSEFVVPMDADDLLAADALHVVAAEIRARQPALIYSDEDTFRDTDYGAPFFRPDFDTVLNAESSYVWHLCAFRRDDALTLGVYADAGAEFCHDWDTITRFAAAGKKIAHTNHVLYHWRSHPASHSNAGGLHPGSIASTKFVLSRTVSQQADPHLYEVAPFPIFRGAEEWSIRRLPHSPPAVAVIVLETDAALNSTTEAIERCGLPFRTVDHHASSDRPWPVRLHAAINAGAEYILILNQECQALEPAGIWDAIKHFEIHRDVAVVSGRVVSAAGRIVDCGTVPDRFGRLVSPFNGLDRASSGPFAMALKAHCILRPADGLFMVRASFAARALQKDLVTASPTPIATAMAICAAAEGAKVVYSPLFESRARVHVDDLPESTSEEFWRTLKDLGVSVDHLPRVMGSAGLLNEFTHRVEHTTAQSSVTQLSDAASVASVCDSRTATGLST